MKKNIKRLVSLAILYLTFLLGLRLVGNQGLIIDRFGLSHNQFEWIETTGTWLIIIIPIIIGVIGLILTVAHIYFPACSYEYYNKLYARLFFFSIIICIILGSKVYRTQKPYIRVLECINNKISIDEFESIANQSGEQLLYITRTGCKDCTDVTNELYHILLSTGISLHHYDTVSDRVENPEQLNIILDKYDIKKVPTLLIFNNGVITEYFEGSNIISGIINHTNNIAEI